MTGVLVFWAVWNAVITLGALGCLAYDRRSDPA